MPCFFCKENLRIDCTQKFNFGMQPYVGEFDWDMVNSILNKYSI